MRICVYFLLTSATPLFLYSFSTVTGLFRLERPFLGGVFSRVDPGRRSAGPHCSFHCRFVRLAALKRHWNWSGQNFCVKYPLRRKKYAISGQSASNRAKNGSPAQKICPAGIRHRRSPSENQPLQSRKKIFK